ncbi:helix-turn-helix transcriptional regulator [Rhodococcus sp. DK176]|uniref:helix-turn-helix transcriptional regulator n=2 Tax=Rhodococcus TaxID=1827 RepID=UPI003989A3E4
MSSSRSDDNSLVSWRRSASVAHRFARRHASPRAEARFVDRAAMHTGISSTAPRADGTRKGHLLLPQPVPRRRCEGGATLEKGPAATSAAPRIRDRVLRALEAHEDGTTSGADIARTLFVSQSHLRRLLRREGVSLRQLRDQHLAARAVEELLQGKPITMLALELGFSDPRAFRRAFKRWTGSTPSTFTRRINPSTTDVPSTPVGDESELVSAVSRQ